MLAEFEFLEEHATEEEWAQKCFEHAASYKEKVMLKARTVQFTNEYDEISFFKHIKPLFTAEVEFHTYLYHIALIKIKEKDHEVPALLAYYKRQLLRIDKFNIGNSSFCDYVESGATNLDRAWFTRRFQCKDGSLFDGLMGKYISNIKLKEYLNKKLTEVEFKIPNI
jgi:hypothetical protein